MNYTWPLATLAVSKENLELSVAGQKLSFHPDQVEKIEAIGFIPYLGKGVQIHHKLDVLTNPTKVIFWHISKDNQWLVDELRSWGYGAIR